MGRTVKPSRNPADVECHKCGGPHFRVNRRVFPHTVCNRPRVPPRADGKSVNVQQASPASANQPRVVPAGVSYANVVARFVPIEAFKAALKEIEELKKRVQAVELKLAMTGQNEQKQSQQAVELKERKEFGQDRKETEQEQKQPRQRRQRWDVGPAAPPPPPPSLPTPASPPQRPSSSPPINPPAVIQQIASPRSFAVPEPRTPSVKRKRNDADAVNLDKEQRSTKKQSQKGVVVDSSVKEPEQESKAVDAEQKKKEKLKSPLRAKLAVMSPFRKASISSPFKHLSRLSFMNSRLWQHAYGHLKSKQRSKSKAKLNDYIERMKKAAEGWHASSTVDQKRASESDFMAARQEFSKATNTLMQSNDSAASIKAAIAPVTISDVFAELRARECENSSVVATGSDAPLLSKESVESKEAIVGKE